MNRYHARHEIRSHDGYFGSETLSSWGDFLLTNSRPRRLLVMHLMMLSVELRMNWPGWDNMGSALCNIHPYYPRVPYI